MYYNTCYTSHFLNKSGSPLMCFHPKVARRLSTRDRQCKCKAVKREKIVECLQTYANVDILHTCAITRSTSRLTNQIGPMLHNFTSMKGLTYQKLTIEKLLKQLILKEVLLIFLPN
jgi:hypothetical protein